LVTPAKIVGASVAELLDHLKLPEYRTRYRAKRELRARDKEEVLSKLPVWVTGLDKSDPNYEHHVLEALWVSWGLNRVDEVLLLQLLNAKDFRARAAAVRVLRYAGHQVGDQAALLLSAAGDEHPRVRLEALVAASWLEEAVGLPIVEAAGKKPLDAWMQLPYEAAMAHLKGHNLGENPDLGNLETKLTGDAREQFIKGEEIYNREGFCITCHQADGNGLSASNFPPLSKSGWVTGSEERLIKLTLNGLMGPMEVNGKAYSGQVPMMSFSGMLTDEEIAAVLTYVRNAFGNTASAISVDKVKNIRAQTKDKQGFYTAEELLQAHPLE
jgi:mono/diheme cytochrome c family protein